MTTKEDWNARATFLRGAAIRLEDRAAGMVAEASLMKTVAAQCDEEADRIRNGENRQNPE